MTPDIEFAMPKFDSMSKMLAQVLPYSLELIYSYRLSYFLFVFYAFVNVEVALMNFSNENDSSVNPSASFDSDSPVFERNITITLRTRYEIDFQLTSARFGSQSLSDSQMAKAMTLAKPWIDYPNYHEVPDTIFSCSKDWQVLPDGGVYADNSTGCQVYHFCTPLRRKMSFLCPNMTVFDQKALACNWWFEVDCLDSSKRYSKSSNEQLLKQLHADTLYAKLPRNISSGQVLNQTSASSSTSTKMFLVVNDQPTANLTAKRLTYLNQKPKVARKLDVATNTKIANVGTPHSKVPAKTTTTATPTTSAALTTIKKLLTLDARHPQNQSNNRSRPGSKLNKPQAKILVAKISNDKKKFHDKIGRLSATQKNITMMQKTSFSPTPSPQKQQNLIRNFLGFQPHKQQHYYRKLFYGLNGTSEFSYADKNSSELSSNDFSTTIKPYLSSTGISSITITTNSSTTALPTSKQFYSKIKYGFQRTTFLPHSSSPYQRFEMPATQTTQEYNATPSNTTVAPIFHADPTQPTRSSPTLADNVIHTNQPSTGYTMSSSPEEKWTRSSTFKPVTAAAQRELVTTTPAFPYVCPNLIAGSRIIQTRMFVGRLPKKPTELSGRFQVNTSFKINNDSKINSSLLKPSSKTARSVDQQRISTSRGASRETTRLDARFVEFDENYFAATIPPAISTATPQNKQNFVFSSSATHFTKSSTSGFNKISTTSIPSTESNSKASTQENNLTISNFVLKSNLSPTFSTTKQENLEQNPTNLSTTSLAVAAVNASTTQQSFSHTSTTAKLLPSTTQQPTKTFKTINHTDKASFRPESSTFNVFLNNKYSLYGRKRWFEQFNASQGWL